MADAQTDFGTRIPERIAADPEKAKNIGAVFLFRISGDGGGTWTLDLKDEVAVKDGEHGTPECTIDISADDWKQMSENPQSAMQLYFQGKLKVTGNPMLATKLQQILG